ncbi:c-type cytochrome [Nitrincola sp. MINF-07-Sa-05]|uniref:c-type cytochrome n=1 Tax=Nitrincola salilacus TaxID=3400273 RepID=UPI003917BD02
MNRLRFVFSTVLLVLAVQAHASETYDDAQMAVMAGSCANCHGTDGQMAGAVPPLAGRSQAAMEAQLLSFKHDENTQATVMNRIAKGFSDEELSALAAHFAAINPN